MLAITLYKYVNGVPYVWAPFFWSREITAVFFFLLFFYFPILFILFFAALWWRMAAVDLLHFSQIVLYLKIHNSYFVGVVGDSSLEELPLLVFLLPMLFPLSALLQSFDEVVVDTKLAGDDEDSTSGVVGADVDATASSSFLGPFKNESENVSNEDNLSEDNDL